MIFRVYIRTPNQRVSDKTTTESKAIALAAFSELVERKDLDGKELAAVLSCDNRQLAFHRFDHPPGTSQDWRGRLDEITFPREGHD